MLIKDLDETINIKQYEISVGANGEYDSIAIAAINNNLTVFGYKLVNMSSERNKLYITIEKATTKEKPICIA